jgi:hypothetical protein
MTDRIASAISMAFRAFVSAMLPRTPRPPDDTRDLLPTNQVIVLLTRKFRLGVSIIRHFDTTAPVLRVGFGWLTFYLLLDLSARVRRPSPYQGMWSFEDAKHLDLACQFSQLVLEVRRLQVDVRVALDPHAASAT